MKVENNLDTDKVRGLVWRLAFPSMLAQFVNVMYSIVDRMYIGNIPEIGALALAGVGICGPVVTLISSFASWIGVGGAPLMSIRLGQKNERAAAQMVANCFALLTGMALIIMTVSYLFKDQLLVFFGAGPAIFQPVHELVSDRHSLCFDFSRHEPVYHMPGICHSGYEISGAGCCQQYCAGSGVHFCYEYGSQGCCHCNRAVTDGVLHLRAAVSVRETSPLAVTGGRP